MTTCEGTRTYQFITNNQVKFTCGEIKIWQNFKNSQNIMTIPWLLQKKNFMAKKKKKRKNWDVDGNNRVILFDWIFR